MVNSLIATMFYRCLIVSSILIYVQTASVANHRSSPNSLWAESPVKSRDTRKIKLSRGKTNAMDLAESVVVYAGGDLPMFDETFNSGQSIVDAVVNIYDLLSERMDKLHSRISAVEGKTQQISDRLNHMDCYDVKIENPQAKNGVYSFHLDYKGKRPIKLRCDMVTAGGGWTVFQQRLPREKNDTLFRTGFLKNFHDYKVGFGSADNDYWLGLDNLHSLTNSRQYEMRVDLQDFNDEKGYAHYNRFYVEDEVKGYRLHVSGYSGNAGDSLSSDEKYDNFTANGMLFSAFDQDYDTSTEINCSEFWNIGGWWFNRCSWANLNGPYHFPQDGKDCVGINWHKWRNKTCLKATKMMIRPVRQS